MESPFLRTDLPVLTVDLIFGVHGLRAFSSSSSSSARKVGLYRGAFALIVSPFLLTFELLNLDG